MQDAFLVRHRAAQYKPTAEGAQIRPIGPISGPLRVFAPAEIEDLSRDQPHESPFGARDRGIWGLGSNGRAQCEPEGRSLAQPSRPEGPISLISSSEGSILFTTQFKTQFYHPAFPVILAIDTIDNGNPTSYRKSIRQAFMGRLSAKYVPDRHSYDRLLAHLIDYQPIISLHFIKHHFSFFKTDMRHFLQMVRDFHSYCSYFDPYHT